MGCKVACQCTETVAMLKQLKYQTRTEICQLHV